MKTHTGEKWNGILSRFFHVEIYQHVIIFQRSVAVRLHVCTHLLFLVLHICIACPTYYYVDYTHPMIRCDLILSHESYQRKESEERDATIHAMAHIEHAAKTQPEPKTILTITSEQKGFILLPAIVCVRLWPPHFCALAFVWCGHIVKIIFSTYPVIIFGHTCANKTGCFCLLHY